MEQGGVKGGGIAGLLKGRGDEVILRRQPNLNSFKRIRMFSQKTEFYIIPRKGGKT